MFDEIEEIVRRNSEEFREQIDNVFALSKEELTEVRSFLCMAFATQSYHQSLFSSWRALTICLPFLPVAPPPLTQSTPPRYRI
jgi:hypothetical protein